VLTNPFYSGRLRDGSASALGPLVDTAPWDKVQALRGRYSRRHRGSIHRRQYTLSMLVACGACGRRITGHGGRYRHVDACQTFKDAAPRTRRAFSRTYDGRVRGESYPADWYDGMIGDAFRKVSASSTLATKTIAKALALNSTNIDSFNVARIARDRDRATTRYLRDRDIASLQATMTRLDAEEQVAQDEPEDVVTPAKARHYLANLWELWQDTEPEGRRAIAEAAFDRIDAIGIDLVVHSAPKLNVTDGLPRSARTRSCARLVVMVGARGIAPSCLTQISSSGSCRQELQRPGSEPLDDPV
jgi:hypothetical protein